MNKAGGRKVFNKPNNCILDGVKEVIFGFIM